MIDDHRALDAKLNNIIIDSANHEEMISELDSLEVAPSLVERVEHVKLIIGRNNGHT